MTTLIEGQSPQWGMPTEHFGMETMEPLIVLLIDELVMSKTHAQQVLKLIVGCIGDQLAATGTAKITGLGTFSVEQRTVKFRPTRGLCAKINSLEAA